MDNLSHSVVGLALGELAHHSLPVEAAPQDQRQRRRLLLTAGWASANFPDLDLLLSGLLPSPLGYLLQHRGHTHTVLYALPQALLLVALIWLLWPGARRLLAHSATARTGLLASVTLGFLSHLAMDYLNSYGIHPFYPFEARWYYGDLVYILEPVFWTVCGVPLALTIASRAKRVTLLALLAGALLLCAWAGFLHWTSLLLLLALAVYVGALQGRAPDGRRALLAGFMLGALFIGVQHLTSTLARQALFAQLRAADPASRVLDIVLTAYPANPLCWNYVSVERDDGAGRYRLRRGALGLGGAACPARLAAKDATFDASLAGLRAQADADCWLRAWLRFARAPVLGAGSASDLRFGAPDEPNFSHLALGAASHAACPAGVPPWTPPRADLLQPVAVNTAAHAP
ncbi:MAG: metal-dependent hydrolase [Massilia sp.]